MEHNDEPHSHTLTFTDNEGQSYSMDHECPGNAALIQEAFDGTNAKSVNNLCIDGKRAEFGTVIRVLGSIDRMGLVGASYMTDENLTKLLIEMGTYAEGTADEEAAREPVVAE